MKRFMAWILVVITVPCIAVAAQHLQAREKILLSAQTPPDGSYDISFTDEAPVADLPALPDISMETVDSVRAAMPAPAEGVIRTVESAAVVMEDAPDVSLFSRQQQRMSPRAIMIDSGVHTLEDLLTGVSDPSLFTREANGDYKLMAPLAIMSGGGLIVRDHEKLYMGADNGAFIINFGRLDIVGAHVLGWDFAHNRPSTFSDHDTFRPYLIAFCGGEMNLAGSSFSDLGYRQAKAYGIVYSSCAREGNETLKAKGGATGRLVGNDFAGIYYGFYSFESSGIRIIGNRYSDNIIYGIDPHDRSKNLIIAKNVVSGTKIKHGIIGSRDVSHSFIFDNVSEHNGGSGLMLDRESRYNVVANNTLRRNAMDGMVFFESGDNIAYNNSMSDNRGVGLRIRNSENIVSREDAINGNAKGGIRAYALDLKTLDTGRDFSKDGFTMAASADIAQTELIDNDVADVTLYNVGRLRLSDVKRYQSPARFIDGDVDLADAPADKSFVVRSR